MAKFLLKSSLISTEKPPTHLGFMVLCNLQCLCVLLIQILVGQGPTVLAAGGLGCLDIIFPSLTFPFFLPPPWRRIDEDGNTVSKKRLTS